MYCWFCERFLSRFHLCTKVVRIFCYGWNFSKRWRYSYCFWKMWSWRFVGAMAAKGAISRECRNQPYPSVGSPFERNERCCASFALCSIHGPPRYQNRAVFHTKRRYAHIDIHTRTHSHTLTHTHTYKHTHTYTQWIHTLFRQFFANFVHSRINVFFCFFFLRSLQCLSL